MSYTPPEPRGGPYTKFDQAEEEIGREEAFAAEQRLAREAEEANGGTPTEKLVRRIRGLFGRGDPPPAG